MQLYNSGLENHPDGSGSLNAIVNGNWSTIDDMISPTFGLTASQTATTVTASASVFTSDDVGATIRFADGTTRIISGYTDGSNVTVGTSGTVASQSFKLYRTDQTAADVIMRGLTKRTRMLASDDGAFWIWSQTDKRLEPVPPVPNSILKCGGSNLLSWLTATAKGVLVCDATPSPAWSGFLHADEANGRLGIGTASPLSPFDINLSGVTTTGFFSTPDINWSKQSATLFFEMGVASSTSASDRPLVQGLRSRGTFAAKSVVMDGDYILSFNGAAHDGTSVVGCADMSIVVDGIPATGKVPTKFVFSTHDNVTAGGPIERMRIDSTGRVGIGVIPTYWLDVKSNAQISSRFDTSSGTQNRVQINHTSNTGIYLAIGGTNKWTMGATSAAFFVDNEAASKIIFALDTTTSAAAFGVYGGIPTFDASAQVQIDSTTRGFLPPRMTTTQKNAISSPSEGLVVYDLTLHKLCVRTASAWETVTSS